MVAFFRLILRGDMEDNAVLCTRDTTYELKVAETSNTLLLTPSLSDPAKPGIQSLCCQCCNNNHYCIYHNNHHEKLVPNNLLIISLLLIMHPISSRYVIF